MDIPKGNRGQAPIKGIGVRHRIPSRRALVLEKVPKLLHGQSRVARDTTHGESIHWIVARSGHDALTIAHDDVLSLSHYAKAGLFERAHGVQVIDAGDLRQG
jgi:hypothetical protein